jgi:hypothetical protein
MPVHGDTIPAACPDVGGLKFNYPTSADGFTYTPYLNIFATISDVMTIPSTVPAYGYEFGWLLASPSVVTVPSYYSIYQYTWENIGDDCQYLAVSYDEDDCMGTGGANKGKNYSIMGLPDTFYFGYWPNPCTGAGVEWAQCLYVQDVVSIPVNVPGSSDVSNPFAPYGFDVGVATVTPLASSGAAMIQLYTESHNAPAGSARILFCEWKGAGSAVPYGPAGFRLPHAFDTFAGISASIAPATTHILLPGAPACMFGTTTAGWSSVPISVPPVAGITGLELIFCSFSTDGLAPSAGYMVTYF